MTANQTRDVHEPSIRSLARRGLAAAFAIAVLAMSPPAAAADAGKWTWPVVGPILRAFDPPDSPFGSGHRGIDIAAATGTVAVAPAAGTVKFSGPVGGHLFVSISHGGGLESTFSWVSRTLVRRGDVVYAGQPVATTGTGHVGEVIPHLHFGAKLDGDYVDPLSLLAPASVVDIIRLVPLREQPLPG